MSQSGTLDRNYARLRREDAAHRFRYETRARVVYEAIEQYLPFRGYYRVLDLGAAEGRTLLEIRRLLGGGHRGSYVGVEASQELVDAAGELPADTRLLLGDAAAPPEEVADGSFDVVCALALLEHVESPERVVEVARDKLRRGGLFVATCPHPVWDQIAEHLELLDGDAHLEALTLERLEALGRIVGETRSSPFMNAVTGALPYLGLCPSPKATLSLDRLLGRLPLPGVRHSFVNQLVVAIKSVGD